MNEAYKAGWDAFRQYFTAAHRFGDDDAAYDELPHLRRELERVKDNGIDYMADFQHGWDDAASLAEEQDIANA